MTGLIRSTIDISLIVQWVALIFGLVAAGSTGGTGGGGGPLGIVLGMENVVQLVEIIFYHWYRWFALGAAAAVDIAWVRYLDWMFTTPVMLVSTALFFEWQKGERGSDGETFSFWRWLGDNQLAVWAMVIANGVMLLVGFLQEIGMLDIVTSTITGFIALGVSFWVLGRMRPGGPGGKNQNHRTSGWLYPFMYVVWALYGVAAMLPALWKNVMYNILDLFSKNFYGMYVAWLVLSR